MPRNPYLPPDAPVDVARAPVKSPGFPFDLVLRVLVGGLLSVYGILSLIWVARSWAWFVDHAILDPWTSPWVLVLSYAMIAATGGALLLRSRYVFLPFAVYCLPLDWHAIGVFGWDQPGVALIGFGVQGAMLSFLLGLVSRNRLR